MPTQPRTAIKEHSLDPLEEPKDVPLQFEPPETLDGKSVNAKDARRKLGYELRAMVKQDEQSKGNLQASAAQVDELWIGRKVQAVEPPWEEAPTFNLQTMRNKINGVKSNIVLPWIKADPYFILKAGGKGGERVDAVETALQMFLNKANWALALTDAVDLSLRRGKCPAKIEYRPMTTVKKRVKKPGLEIDPIDTMYFRIYPNTANEFEKARLVGDVIQVPAGWVLARQENGWYFWDRTIVSGTQQINTMQSRKGDKQTSTDDAIYMKDQAIDLFVGLYSDSFDDEEDEECWYEVVLAIDSGDLLHIREKQTDADVYHDFFTHRETGRYYNESSLGTLLVDTHHWVNFNSDMMGWISMWAGMPPIVGVGLGLPDEVIDVKPGTFINIDEGGQFTTMGGTAHTEAFPGLLELAKRTADETSGLSQNGLGANLRSNTTATEAQQVAIGQATGIESYQLLGFVHGAVSMARAALILLGENFDDWYPEYQDVLPEGLSADDFLKEYYIEINGQTPIDTPAAVMQQVTALMQAYAQAVQLDPTIAQLYPEFIPELLRGYTESTTLSTKDKAMPTREEEAQRKEQLAQAQMQQQEMMRSAFEQQLQQQLAGGQGAGQESGGGDNGKPAGPPASRGPG